MRGQIFFVPGKRKYLFCADLKGMKILQPIIEQAVENNISFDLVFIGEEKPNPTNLSRWFRGQKMGSYLYAAAAWDMLKILKPLAGAAGFSNEETQYMGYGEQKMNVFCCRCHGITEMILVKKESLEIMCCHCELWLEVSDHYSSLRDAHLGYVAKL